MTGNQVSTEIYRTSKNAREFRSVYARVDEDGAFRMDAQDMGPLVEEMFGDADYEFGINLTPEQSREFLLHLVNERYGGRADAIDAFEADVKQWGVAFKKWSLA